MQALGDGRHGTTPGVPVDIEPLLTPPAPTPGRSGASGCNQEFARDLVPQLEELRELVIFEKPRALVSTVLGAVRQIANGRTDYVQSVVGQNIVAFKDEINQLSRTYANLTCYDDVVKCRAILSKAGKSFSMLDEILARVVDYAVPCRQEGG